MDQLQVNRQTKANTPDKEKDASQRNRKGANYLSVNYSKFWSTPINSIIKNVSNESIDDKRVHPTHEVATDVNRSNIFHTDV